MLTPAQHLGDDGMTEYDWRLNKPPKGKPRIESVAERKLLDEITKNFRIYFPTRNTVANSKGGLGVSRFVLYLSTKLLQELGIHDRGYPEASINTRSVKYMHGERGSYLFVVLCRGSVCNSTDIMNYLTAARFNLFAI